MFGQPMGDREGYVYVSGHSPGGIRPEWLNQSNNTGESIKGNRNMESPFRSE